jgi:hypothetical protein
MVVTIYTTCFNIEELNIVSKKCFYVFHTIITKKSSYFPI